MMSPESHGRPGLEPLSPNGCHVFTSACGILLSDFPPEFSGSFQRLSDHNQGKECSKKPSNPTATLEKKWLSLSPESLSQRHATYLGAALPKMWLRNAASGLGRQLSGQKLTAQA